MRRVLALGLAVTCVCLLDSHVRARQNPPPPPPDPIIDAQGAQHGRNYLSQLPFERIDPLTGNVLLTFTDLELPGNAGFNLQIVRSYNSKAPAGWSFGLAGIPYRIDNPQGTPSAPKLRMPDAARVDTFLESGSLYRTKEFWQYNTATGKLQFTDGSEAFYSTTTGNLLSVQDTFGNQITLTYRPSGGEIERFTQNLGNGQTRVVTLGAGSLPGRIPASMTLGSFRTWTYRFDTGGNLRFVEPPVERLKGTDWEYQYDPNLQDILRVVKTPNLGTITYDFTTLSYLTGHQSRVLYLRTMNDGVNVPATWVYNYSTSFGTPTLVTGPDGNDTNYIFETPAGASEPVLRTIQRIFNFSVIETDTRTYRFQPVTTFNGGNAVLLKTRTVTRGGLSYSTIYQYHETLFADYGRPYQIDELGENQYSRTTAFTFDYDFDTNRWIKDKVKGLSVQTNADAQPFPITREFNFFTGFMESETRYGVTTQYAADARGNIREVTDPHPHPSTTFTYDWGVVDTTVTPMYTIDRVINSIDGTVASETRGLYTRSFSYDNIGRPTLVTPADGHAIQTVYHDTLIEETRSNFSDRTSTTSTTLDGFGRTTRTSNSMGVYSTTSYDALGRLRSESLPRQGATSFVGTTYSYDALDRIRQETRTGGHTITYEYQPFHRVHMTEINRGADGVDVTRQTVQQWASFGDPAEQRLVIVTDAENHTWNYKYNGLGRLTEVAEPLGGIRAWAYEPGSDRLATETHPERGQTSYSYSGGRLTSKGTARSSFTYGYDANDRVTTIANTYPFHNITMKWDANDNREELINHYVTSKFSFDGANRLKWRKDTSADDGVERLLQYQYNGFDDRTKITYPSGNAVLYEYDSASRVKKVTREGAGTAIAEVQAYHPSGAIQTLKYGNNIVETSEFDPNRYWLKKLTGGPVNLCYDYDRVGNVEFLKDFDQNAANCAAAGGQLSRQYRYDKVDRLQYVYNGVSTLIGQFSYDAIGNRTSNSIAGLTYTYFPLTRQMSVTGPQGFPGVGAYQFDTAGGMQSGPLGHNLYTPFDMVEVATVNGNDSVYHYDGDNLRKVRVSGSKAYYYYHGPSSELLTEYVRPDAGPARWSRDYVYLAGRLVGSMSTPVLVGFTTSTSTVEEKSPAIATATVRVTTPDGQALQSAVSVPWTTGGGTATPNGDYVPASGTLTFPAGTASGDTRTMQVSIMLDAVGDGNISEPDETFEIRLSPPVNASVTTPATHTVTIIDDEPLLLGYIDIPQPGVRYLPFDVGGWAINRRATTGTGIDVIRVYATPSGGGPLIMLGQANVGPRQDIANYYGANFLNSGFGLRVPHGALTIGSSYNLGVEVHFTYNDTWQSLASVPITIQEGAVIDLASPTGSGTLRQRFTVSGYALDRAEVAGTGIDAVDIHAFPHAGGQIFLGRATLGGSSPAAATAYGPRFANAGYTLDVASLPVGTHQLHVYAHKTGIGWIAPFVRTITVASDPLMYLETPTHSVTTTTGQPFAVSGWAIDRAAATGSGVSTVHLWAHPVGGGTSVFLGAPAPDPRQYVADIFGPQFLNSGFRLSATPPLAPGTYEIRAYAMSALTATFNNSMAGNVTIPTPDAYVSIDAPGANATVGQPFLFSGWAVDRNSPNNVGIKDMHLYAFPHNGGNPTLIGVVPVYAPRPDVAAYYNKPFLVNSGWGIHVTGLAAGTYTLVAHPVSTANVVVPGGAIVVITVQ